MCVYFNDPATGYECQQSRPSRLGANEYTNLYGDSGVCVCILSVCVLAHVCPRVRACVIKIIILHFLQIRHTDDFPSTGTRLVPHNAT